MVLTLVALGLGASPAHAEGTLTVTYTTQPHGGNYAPRNIVAVWVEDAGGNFVRTIDRWAATRRQHLVDWTAKAGATDADAVSGATRLDHTTPLTATWDLVSRQGLEIGDGTYTIRMELADSNATTPAQNAQGTFTFTKDAMGSSQTGLSNGGFTNVSITYAPGAPSATCGNGQLDAGETCDPIGSCPASCPASGDPCMVNTLVGSAAACTAECVIVPADTPACAGAGADSDVITGGCSTGGGSPGALALVLLALGLRRRRR